MRTLAGSRRSISTTQDGELWEKATSTRSTPGLRTDAGQVGYRPQRLAEETGGQKVGPVVDEADQLDVGARLEAVGQGGSDGARAHDHHTRAHGALAAHHLAHAGAGQGHEGGGGKAHHQHFHPAQLGPAEDAVPGGGNGQRADGAQGQGVVAPADVQERGGPQPALVPLVETVEGHGQEVDGAGRGARG